MEENKFSFNTLYSDSQEINNIKSETKKEYKNLINKIKNDSKEKDLEKSEIKNKIKEVKFFLKIHYLDKIDLILKKFELTKTNFKFSQELILEKQIVYNYFNMLKYYFIQKSKNSPKYGGTIKYYFNICLRILEFAIYVNIKKIENVKEIVFNKKEINICFYSHFVEIKNEILLNNRNIIFYGKNNNSLLTLDEKLLFVNNKDWYNPISKPTNESEDDSNSEPTFWFERFFRVNDKQISDVFNGIGSAGSISTKGAKGKRPRRSDDILDFLDENIYNKNSLQENNQDLENILESTQAADVISSAILLEKDIVGFKIRNKHVNSNYKNFLIDKKISNNMAKNEMFLYSKAPNRKVLKELIKKILDDDREDKEESYYRKLIMVSLFTGISIENLIDSFCKKINNIIFEKDNLLKIKHEKSIFAKNVTVNDEILIPTIKNNNSTVVLPSMLSNMVYHIKNSIDNIFIETLNEEEYKKMRKIEINKCGKILGASKRNLSKSISYVTIKSIHRLFFHYYHLSYGYTDTGILPMYKVSNNNRARVCYVAQPKRLIYYEKWMIDFLNKFTENNILFLENIQNNQKMIGSPKVIKDKPFKLFLKNITKLSPKNNIEKFNLQMIFIRYSLSILLATRNFNTSCELLEFSEKLGLLTIHEKAKHVNSSKRLIKVSPRAVKYIKLFFELKREFSYDGYAPILIKVYKSKKYKDENHEFIDLNKKTVLEFLGNYSQNKRYEELVKFIKIVELNFGRHVFATESLSKKLKKDYENEFMGHYSKGNLGFGIFSNMKSESYLNTVEKFMKKIERIYFSNKINPRNIKCKEKKILK